MYVFIGLLGPDKVIRREKNMDLLVDIEPIVFGWVWCARTRKSVKMARKFGTRC